MTISRTSLEASKKGRRGGQNDIREREGGEGRGFADPRVVNDVRRACVVAWRSAYVEAPLGHHLVVLVVLEANATRCW